MPWITLLMALNILLQGTALDYTANGVEHPATCFVRSASHPPVPMIINTVPSELLQEPAMLQAVKRLGRVCRRQRWDGATVHVADKPVDCIQHRRLRGVARTEAMLLGVNDKMFV